MYSYILELKSIRGARENNGLVVRGRSVQLSLSMRRATALTTIKPDFESDYHRYHSCLSYIPDSLKSITAIITQLHSELTAYKLTSMCLADVIWRAWTSLVGPAGRRHRHGRPRGPQSKNLTLKFTF